MSASPSSFKNKFLQKIFQTIIKYGMLQSHDSVLIGVSGGPDSMALVHVMQKMSRHFSLKLGIAHLNHCLRGKDSDRDAQFVQDFANKLNISYYFSKENVYKYQKIYKLSLEEAARQVRYEFYNKTAKDKGFNKIALGHHADDNAELVLMYFLRGSGPLGISGIRPIRDSKFIRPFIHVSRSEIMLFLKEIGQDNYVTDMSNLDTKYLRNQIRHQLIPMLKSEYNPKIVNTINKLSSIIRQEDQWIEEIIIPYFNKCILSSKDNKIKLSINELLKLHTAPRQRIIRKAIAKVKGNLRRITFNHINDIIDLLSPHKTNKSLDLPERIHINRTYGILCIEKKAIPLRSLKKNNTDTFKFEYIIPDTRIFHIKETGMTLKFSEIKIKKQSDISLAGQNIAFFDMDALNFPLVVRNFRHGDRFTPLGAGGTQKVKKYFINKKVPPEFRLKCPIILYKNKIIWLAGYCIDESVKLTDLTCNVLKVELLLA